MLNAPELVESLPKVNINSVIGTILIIIWQLWADNDNETMALIWLVYDFHH